MAMARRWFPESLKYSRIPNVISGIQEYDITTAYNPIVPILFQCKPSCTSTIYTPALVVHYPQPTGHLLVRTSSSAKTASAEISVDTSTMVTPCISIPEPTRTCLGHQKQAFLWGLKTPKPQKTQTLKPFKKPYRKPIETRIDPL